MQQAQIDLLRSAAIPAQQLFIGGRPAQAIGEARLDVVSPIDGKVLTTIADGTPPIGMSLGTWTGSACQVVIDNSNAAQSAIITGTVTAAAALCARVYDAHGTITNPADFTITVGHP